MTDTYFQLRYMYIQTSSRNAVNKKLFLTSLLFSTYGSKKIFEISANQSILLALADMLNIRLERKTETL
jgi:hypothetical protein